MPIRHVNLGQDHILGDSNFSAKPKDWRLKQLIILLAKRIVVNNLDKQMGCDCGEKCGSAEQ